VKLRELNTALHRDLGFFFFGLSLLYAVSGLAVNHVHQWNPNFSVDRVAFQASLPSSASPEEISRALLLEMGVSATPRAVVETGPDQVQVFLESRTLTVQPSTGAVVDERVSRRPLLYAFNWLHENRGKGAWTWFADAYAVGLLVLACTGLFILRGRKGLWGRGGLYALAGLAAPIVYWVLAGE
jgi:uncharacterized protein